MTAPDRTPDPTQQAPAQPPRDLGASLLYAGSSVTIRDRTRQLEELLMQAALMLSSYRRKGADSGFPFREPPGANQLILDIDSVFEDKQKAKRGF